MRASLSLKSLFGTLALLLVFVVLLIIILYSKTDSPLFYLVASMLIGIAIALISCIQNMNYTIKIKKEQQDILQNEVFLNNCPEYWVKHKVVNPENNKVYNMCYNDKKLTQEGTYLSNKSGVDEENYVTVDKDSSGVEIYNIGNMRNRAKYDDVQENFTNEQYFYGHPNYDSHSHVHEDVNVVFSGNNVSPTPNTTAQISPHTHPNMPLSGRHSHSSDGNNNSTGLTFDQYQVTDKNFENWINPYTKQDGNTVMEINLDELNSTNNKCDLARQLPWTEAYSKCL